MKKLLNIFTKKIASPKPKLHVLLPFTYWLNSRYPETDSHGITKEKQVAARVGYLHAIDVLESVLRENPKANAVKILGEHLYGK